MTGPAQMDTQGDVRMKGIRTLVAAIAFFCSHPAGAGVEMNKDVGFGFRLVIRSEPTRPGAFERVAQYGYFFYKDRELGQYESYSVSPSGKYALFQIAPAGDVVLFAPGTAKRRVVAKLSGSRAHQYVWMEAQSEATIEFENKTSVRVPLRAH
jgi:hypothetical protein